MALSTPTTQQVADNIVAQIETEISKQIRLLPRSFTRVLAKALAGIFVLVYRYAGWSLLQMFVQHASFRETTVNGRKIRPLIEWGRLVGVGDPAIATNARHTVAFTVLDWAGNPVIPAGSQLVHPDSGVIYITEADYTLIGPGGTIGVIAASDPDGNGGAGLQGNRALGDNLKWANAIPQVDSQGVYVIATVTTAEDGETEDAYRKRVVDAFSARPQGGAYADYRTWATEDPTIINAYPYTSDTPGMVDVYIEATVASSDADGIPKQSHRDTAKASIELDSSGLATRRPVSAYVNVLSIFRQPFDVTVTTLSPDTTANRDVIEEALDDWLRTREPYIVGLSKLPRLDRVTTANISGVVDEAAAAVGATVADVQLTLGGQPVTAYTLGFGQKAKVGIVTYL